MDIADDGTVDVGEDPEDPELEPALEVRPELTGLVPVDLQG